MGRRYNLKTLIAPCRFSNDLAHDGDIFKFYTARCVLNKGVYIQRMDELGFMPFQKVLSHNNLRLERN